MFSARHTAKAGATFCSVLLAAAAAIVPVAARGETKPTVTVVNPATNPVNTRITNSVVPVEISNADAIPVTQAETEGGRISFWKSVTVDLGSGSTNCNNSDPVTIPTGKRLVVEYLSANGAFTAPTALMSISLAFAGNGGPAGLLAVVPAGKTVQDSAGNNHSAAGQYLHVYSTLTLWACVSVSSASTQDINVNIAGYLVDLP